MSQRLFLVFLVSILTACDCGGGGAGLQGEPCTVSSECEMGLECVDLRCDVSVLPDSGGDEDGGVDAQPDVPMMCEAMQRPCGAECCSGDDVCDGTTCCPNADICDGACCGDGHACVADRCVVSCEEGESVCGAGDSVDCCGGDTVCYLGECTMPGAECMRSVDCPADQYCETAIGNCLPRSMTGETCEYRPDLETFELSEEWSWTGDDEVMVNHNQIMQTPMVANLTDDNDDGVIDENDIPDIVFTSYRPTGTTYRANGVLRAISGDDGHRIWPTEPPAYLTTPSAQVAIAELDSDHPGPEIVTCSAGLAIADPRHPLLIAANGVLIREYTEMNCGGVAPAIADMDGDGIPEILVAPNVFHADGTVILSGMSAAYNGLFANMDDDPDLELVTGNSVVDMDGTVLWTRAGDFGPGRPAVADLDLDGHPEVVTVVASTHHVWVLNGRDGSTIWDRDVNPPEVADRIAARMMSHPSRDASTGGGPPTIANFDDDPEPEIALAGGYAYIVFDSDGDRLWFAESQDISSRATGSSIFDFEGDGVAEVLYNDELTFRVFQGNDGSVFYDRCNTSGTLVEYPIVVDVDNDDHAEIILMENNYAFNTCGDGSASTTGIHVFGHPDNQWVRTRRIWNQHSYHVTNINEDGTVPTREETNWTTEGLNNFRQNVQPDGLFDAPDLVAQDLAASQSGCGAELRLSVRVVNEGRASAPAGVPVTFYETSSGSDIVVGRGVTSRALLPGESEIVESDAAFALPAGREADVFEFVARINEGDELSGVNECRTGNNDIGPVEGHCPTIG